MGYFPTLIKRGELDSGSAMTKRGTGGLPLGNLSIGNGHNSRWGRHQAAAVAPLERARRELSKDPLYVGLIRQAS